MRLAYTRYITWYFVNWNNNIFVTNFIEGICSNDTSYDLTDPPTALSKAEILNNQVFFDLPFLHLISLSLSKQLYIACHYMFDNIFIKNHYSHSVSTRRWSPNVTVTNHTLLLDWNSWGAFDVCSVHYYIPFYFRKLLHTKYTKEHLVIQDFCLW
jgi:hypothetical protein